VEAKDSGCITSFIWAPELTAVVSAYRAAEAAPNDGIQRALAP